MKSSRFRRLAWAVAGAVFVPTVAFGFITNGRRWATATVTLDLGLGYGSAALSDGSASFDDAALAAIGDWNGNLSHLRLTGLKGSVAPIGDLNGHNNIIFSSTIYGDAFGDTTLAVTVSHATDGVAVESDILFNDAVTWDSYRGPLRAAIDLRRVAAHELGHLLGLGHPDEYGQSVVALMNAYVSDLDSLAPDDIAGAIAIYETAPQFTTQPTGATLSLGGSAAMSAAAIGASSWQWRKNGAAIVGATHSYLNLAAVQATDAGTYTVVAANSVGSVTSNAAVLNVIVPMPAFTTQPQSQTVVVSADVTFTTSVTNATAYQWYHNGAALPGKTTSSLTLPNVQTTDAGTYYLVASNSAGAATSNNAVLTVNAPTSAPTITQQPTQVIAALGGSASLSVTATNVAHYQWYLNGTAIAGATGSSYDLSAVAIADLGNYYVIASNAIGGTTSNAVVLYTLPVITRQPVGQAVAVGKDVLLSVTALVADSYQWSRNATPIAGATNATLTMTAVTSAVAGNYYVQASNAFGSVTSATATLTVVPPPAISEQPQSQTVIAGAKLSLTVTATGATGYQWSKDGKPITGATVSTYAVNNAGPSVAGSYQVEVSNAGGSVTSNTVTVTVITAPIITVNPTSQTVTIGNSVTFSVTATGATGYQWTKNGADMPGATSSTLTFASATPADAGTYAVYVSNAAGRITSYAATLAVNPVMTNIPSITAQPVGQTAAVGQRVTLSVTATNVTTYQWTKDGVPLLGANASTLSFPVVQPADAGTYAVVVSNANGKVTSNAVVVKVGASVLEIAQPPSSQTARVGTTVVFSVTAPGATTYQWRKDGVDLAGQTGAALTLAAVKVADAGTYTVVVGNGVNSVVSAAAILTVSSSAPVFTLMPVSQSLVYGDKLVLSVAATDATSYQWTKNGVDIAGANGSSYVLDFVLAGDAGTYRATAANAVGQVASSVAVVTVTAPVALAGAPAFRRQPESQSVAIDAMLSLAVDCSGDGVTYQWYKDNRTLAGATAPLFTKTMSAGDVGRYTVVAANGYGRVISNEAVVTLPDASKFINLSVRSNGAGGDNSLIGGFVIRGSTPKTVLVRAVGPTLGSFGVRGAMGDPRLEVFDGARSAAVNDNWSDDATLVAVTTKVGAFPLNWSSKDAALVTTLAPGAYTAVVTPADGQAGIVLLEVYEVP